jgi:hypothetical protein
MSGQLPRARASRRSDGSGPRQSGCAPRPGIRGPGVGGRTKRLMDHPVRSSMSLVPRAQRTRWSGGPRWSHARVRGARSGQAAAPRLLRRGRQAPVERGYGAAPTPPSSSTGNESLLGEPRREDHAIWTPSARGSLHRRNVSHSTCTTRHARSRLSARPHYFPAVNLQLTALYPSGARPDKPGHPLPVCESTPSQQCDVGEEGAYGQNGTNGVQQRRKRSAKHWRRVRHAHPKSSRVCPCLVAAMSRRDQGGPKTAKAKLRWYPSSWAPFSSGFKDKQ